MPNALDAIRMQMAVLALIFASWARFDNIVTIGQIKNIPTKTLRKSQSLVTQETFLFTNNRNKYII